MSHAVNVPASRSASRSTGCPSSHVDQDRAVVMPPPEREIVHAEHCHHRDGRVGQAADQPQQAAAADGHAQGGRQPRPWPAGQRQRDRDHHAAQQRGPAGVAGSQVGNLLGEGACRAVRVVAEEPTRREPDRRRPAADHCIGQRAHISTVHASRFLATASAPRPRRASVSAYLHPVHVGRDTVDDQQHQMGQQNSQPPVHSGTALLVLHGFLAEPGISQEGLSHLTDTPRINVTNWLLQQFSPHPRKPTGRRPRDNWPVISTKCASRNLRQNPVSAHWWPRNCPP